MNRIYSFIADEEGAISVDWVILAAGVISLAMAATSVVVSGTGDLSGEIDTTLKNPSLIKTTFD